MKAIVAIDKNGAIGYKGKLLFHCPKDLAHFKAYTKGKRLVMGSKTFESLPKMDLAGRELMVLSKRPMLIGSNPIATQCQSLDELVFNCNRQTVVIGGESIYRQLIPLCQEVVVTRFEKEAEQADAFFDMELLKDFKMEGQKRHFCRESGLFLNISTYRI